MGCASGAQNGRPQHYETYLYPPVFRQTGLLARAHEQQPCSTAQVIADDKAQYYHGDKETLLAVCKFCVLALAEENAALQGAAFAAALYKQEHDAEAQRHSALPRT